MKSKIAAFTMIVMLAASGLNTSRGRGSADFDLSIHLGYECVRLKDAPEINTHHFFGTQQVVFYEDIKNMGPAQASGLVDISIYLNTTRDLNGQPILVVTETKTIPSIAPGHSIPVAVEGTIPKTAKPGQKYYLISKLTPKSFQERSDQNSTIDNVYVTEPKQYEFVGTPTNSEPFKLDGEYTNFLRALLGSPKGTLHKQIQDFLKSKGSSLAGKGDTVFLDDKYNFIETFEGDRLSPYLDSSDPPNLTIGKGINLTAQDDSVIHQLAEAVRNYTHENMSDSQLLNILRYRAQTGDRRPVISQADDDRLSRMVIDLHVQRTIKALGRDAYQRIGTEPQVAAVDIDYAADIDGFRRVIAALKKNPSDRLVAAFNIVDSGRMNDAVTKPNHAGDLPRVKFEFIDMLLTHADDAGEVRAVSECTSPH